MNLANILTSFFALSAFNAINDKRRLKAVVDSAQALVEGETLTLTGLGRHMKHTETKVKHCIKRVCRLLGNAHLQRERVGVYASMTRFLLRHTKYPLIIVDWSPVNHVDKQILRATLPIGGRAFTLYEQVHPESELGSLKAHKSFIRRLAAMIPDGVTPIVTTDAGFNVPWFKPIEQQGWYWLGRVRGNSQLYTNGQWHNVSDLFLQATCKAQHLGDAWLTNSHQHPCQLVRYQKKPQGRKDKNWSVGNSRDSTSRAHAQGQREPWLLVTNLPKDDWFAQSIVALYTQRMSIEEGFRDTKNERFGLALNFTGSQCPKRIEILLMIAMLTQVALLTIGNMAYSKGYYKTSRPTPFATARCYPIFT